MPDFDMPDLRVIIVVVGFLLIFGFLLSNGVVEVFEQIFDSIQPNNPNFSTSFTSKTISFLIVTLIALGFAFRLVGMK